MILLNEKELPVIEKLYIPIGAFGNQLSFNSQDQAFSYMLGLLLGGHVVKLDCKDNNSEHAVFTVRWGEPRK